MRKDVEVQFELLRESGNNMLNFYPLYRRGLSSKWLKSLIGIPCMKQILTWPEKAERQFRKSKEERENSLQAIRQEKERAVLEAENQERAKMSLLLGKREMLPEIIPEWRDTKVAQKEASDLRSFLLKEGFLEADINELRHAGLVKLARMAMLFDQGQSKAVKAKAKPKAKAKTMKTGTRGSQPRPKAANEQALQRARTTGRVQKMLRLQSIL